jgi:hypothetical protein
MAVLATLVEIEGEGRGLRRKKGDGAREDKAPRKDSSIQLLV